MSWKTKYLKLTKEQREKGVVFSSILKATNHAIEEVMYEVRGNDPEKDEKINCLKNVEFFKYWAKMNNYNVVHEIRR